MPVKMMKSVKEPVARGECARLDRAANLLTASDGAVAAGKAATVLTYLHGVKEAENAAEVGWSQPKERPWCESQFKEAENAAEARGATEAAGWCSVAAGAAWRLVQPHSARALEGVRESRES